QQSEDAEPEHGEPDEHPDAFLARGVAQQQDAPIDPDQREGHRRDSPRAPEEPPEEVPDRTRGVEPQAEHGHEREDAQEDPERVAGVRRQDLVDGGLGRRLLLRGPATGRALVGGSAAALAGRAAGTPRGGSLRGHGEDSLTRQGPAASNPADQASMITGRITGLRCVTSTKYRFRTLLMFCCKADGSVTCASADSSNAAITRRRASSRMSPEVSSWTKPRFTTSGPSTSSPDCASTVTTTTTTPSPASLRRSRSTSPPMSPIPSPSTNVMPARTRSPFTTRSPISMTSPSSQIRMFDRWMPTSSARRAWCWRCRRSPCTGMNHRGRTSDSSSRSSSCAAWPLAWTGSDGMWNTFAPLRYSASTTRWIAGSLPGIKLEDRTTVSPSARLTHLCARAAIRLSAEYGSPWLPVQMITTRPGSNASTSEMSITS